MKNSSKPIQRALIVEDDPSWQQILTELLSDAGLTVDVTDNLEAAIRILKDNPHRLALVDLSLEGSDHHNEDGLRVLEAIKRLDPECQSILLTGFATVELAVNVLTDFRAFSFLRKENFNRTQFRELVNQVLAAAPFSASNSTDPNITIKDGESDDNGKSSTSSARVLVVEDDAGWRSILSELIDDSGFEVRLCAGYGDALGALKREHFDLAVVDLSLTKEISWDDHQNNESLEGYSLLSSAYTSGIPTIVVSGVASVDEIQRAYKEHSVFAYLEKQTFDRTSFKRLVTEALLSGKALSEFGRLTGREREVFDLLAKGLTNQQIAEALVVTNNTVKRHLKSIFEKLKVHNRAAAISRARRNP